MANNNPVIGLRPVPDAKGAVNTRVVPISASNTKALGVNSPISVIAGQAAGVVTYVDGSEQVDGTVVKLMTTSGKAVTTVPASTAGYKAEITTDPDQEFIITMAGTGFTDADAGKTYSLTEETLVANTDGFTGGFSKRQLQSTTEADSGEQFVVLGRSGALNNAAATDNVEVRCRINREVPEVGGEN